MSLFAPTKWLLPFVIFGIGAVLGRELTPIRPDGRSGNIKRQETSGMDLRRAETFLWGEGSASKTVANLTIEMPDEISGILAMESFDALTTSIECNQGNITMNFDNGVTFAYAQLVWKVVNEAVDNTFVMVAGAGDCGNNTERIPFSISNVEWDAESDQAILTAEQVKWKDFASYELRVGSISQATNDLAARDIDKSTSIDVAREFPFTQDLIPFGQIIPNLPELKLSCADCKTTGSFEIELIISQTLGIPTGASMKISPRGVSTSGRLRIEGKGAVTKAITKVFNIVEVPIGGVTIPGILDLGPFLTLGVGAEILPLRLTAGVTAGAFAKLSDEAILEVNILSPEENNFSGWEPVINEVDVSVDGSITGGVGVFLQPALELQAEALGKGFTVGLSLKVPNLTAKLSVSSSTDGACAGTSDASNQEVGVTASINIGAALLVKAIKKDEVKPLFTLPIAQIETPLASKCLGFGGNVTDGVTGDSKGNSTTPLVRRAHLYRGMSVL